MKFILCFIFLFNIARADELFLKNLGLNSSISEELSIIVNHLRSVEVSKEEAIRVTTACTLINEDIKKLDNTNLLFLIKSEIYKGLLNNQYISYSDSLQISEVIVKSIEAKFKKYKISYLEFSQWIYQSLIRDLAPYRDDNFLDRYQTIDRTNMKEKAKALELKKVLKYLSPWVIAFESKTPEEFNQLMTNISIDILEKISKKTYFFKAFASKFSQIKQDELFNVPNIEIELEKELTPPDSSVQEIKEERSKEAKESLKQLESNGELENPSKAIDTIMDDSVDKDDQWVPKESEE